MTSTASLTIRHANAADEADLTRLAALDSSRVPSGELLVAQVDGNLVAALSVDTGAAIADPFEHTAAIVDSMRAQVARVPRAAPGDPRPATSGGRRPRSVRPRARVAPRVKSPGGRAPAPFGSERGASALRARSRARPDPWPHARVPAVGRAA